MGDDFRRAQPGEPFRMPAAVYNGLLDLLRERGARPAGAGAAAQGRNPWLLRVRNDTGGDLQAREVVGLGDPVWPDADPKDPSWLVNLVKAVALTPAHAQRFAVMQQPLAEDAIGWALAGGVAMAEVNVLDEAHGFAHVTDASGHFVPALLQSADRGPAAILWRPAGCAGTTVPCLIVFGGPAQAAGTVFIGKIAGYTGDAGGDGNDCSFTYVVTDLDGYALFGGQYIAPEWARLPGTEYAAAADDSPALLWLDPDGDLHLLAAPAEQPGGTVVALVSDVTLETDEERHVTNFAVEYRDVRVLDAGAPYEG